MFVTEQQKLFWLDLTVVVAKDGASDDDGTDDKAVDVSTLLKNSKIFFMFTLRLIFMLN